MNDAADFDAVLARANSLFAGGRHAEAEQAYRQLTTSSAHRETALQALINLFLQTGRPMEAADALTALTNLVPNSLDYCTRLATLLDAVGQVDSAIAQFQRILNLQPDNSTAYFNFALLLKKNKLYADAVRAYEDALRIGIDHEQSVYSNLGVLYSEMRIADKAGEMYQRALEVDPEYLPALFNYAGWFEEAGDKPRALELFRKILEIEPGHWEALSRIVHAQRVTKDDESLLTELQSALARSAADPVASEGLFFALGKSFDDLGRYDRAFAAYTKANEIGKRRNQPYDARATETAIGGLINVFSAERVGNIVSDLDAKPIFICGMFRSGSTLIEQILASHPEITAGGELDFLPLIIRRRLSPYPEQLKSTSAEQLKSFGAEYLSMVEELFPNAVYLTDKRPDNFAHIGLIHQMFPGAKIVCTKRDARDNCLSIYFQQLGGNLSYATSLSTIAHYYQQHERLMEHWAGLLNDSIFTVDYDGLVRDPEPILRQLFAFLGVPWDERCLDFSNAGSPVKTASVWQVREKLNSLSSGRWRNYETYAGKLLDF
jgi:tetratricopeptide (TPR) repeat protein